MKVDGKPFKIYFLDGRKSIKERLASIKKIPQEYLYLEYDGEEKIKTETIQSYMESVDSFSSYFKNARKKYDIDSSTLLKIWYKYKLDEGSKPYNESEIDDIVKNDGLSIFKLKREYDRFLKDEAEALKSLNERVQENIALSRELETIKEIHSTPEEILSVKTEVCFSVDYDIFELFNRVNLSSDIPFMSILNYYKILTDFTPSLDWTNYRDRIVSDFGNEKDVLYMKVLNVKNYIPGKEIDYRKYSNVSIIFNKKGRLNNVKMRLDASVSSDISEDEIVNRILSNFIGSIKIDSRRHIQVKGEFLIPKLNLERYIFLDMISNDSIISRICSVDERFGITRKKHSIYLYFNSEEDNTDDLVTCSILEKTVEKTSLNVIAKDSELKVGTNYIRVFVNRARSSVHLSEFKLKICKLFSYYTKKYDSIFKKYVKYMDSFQTILEAERRKDEDNRKKSTRTKHMLKDIDPDQFISGYSRWLCPTKRAPRIIGTADDSLESERLQENGYQTMLFPKNRLEDGKEYKQYYYSCDHHSQDKFPGLRINKLSNFERYPIVPCCYKKDHTVKNKSVWRKYYEQDKNFGDFKKDIENIKDEDDRHIYKTNKFAKPKRYGVFNNNIIDYFKTIDYKNIYYRQGMTRGYSSVIECLISSLDPDFDGYTDLELKDLVLSTRKSLVSLIDSVNCFQESNTYTLTTLKNYLLDENKYLDPKSCIKLLEKKFECRIFIFSQGRDDRGKLSCPYHNDKYLYTKIKKSTPVVLIYEHFGSELDMAEYPQCELIVKINSNKSKQYSFSLKNQIVSRTVDIFKKMYGDPSPRLKFKSKISCVKLDYYGKCIKIQFNNRVQCTVTPCIVEDAPIGECIDHNVEPSTIKDFIDYENIEILKSTSNRDIISFECVKDGVYLSFCSYNISIKNTSILGEFCDHSRTVKYLYEYVKYLFSLDYNGENITDEYIRDFVVKNTIIKKNHEYKKLNREFTTNSEILIDRKIIVPDEKVIDRLIYYLKLKRRDDVKELIDYKNNKYLLNYYTSVSDFETIDSQPIVQGTSLLIRWIKNSKNSYTLNNSIVHKDITIFQKLDTMNRSLPYMFIFYAKWNKQSRILLRYIYKKDKKCLFSNYNTLINFVYLNIDENKGILDGYGVDRLPTVLFLDYKNNILTEKDRITIDGDVKLLNLKIQKTLGLEIDSDDDM